MVAPEVLDCRHPAHVLKGDVALKLEAAYHKVEAATAGCKLLHCIQLGTLAGGG